jgi:hypothetical protein
MIKKYLLDILCIIGVVIIALLATQRPGVNLKLPPSGPPLGDKRQIPDAKKEEKERGQKEIVKEVVVLGALKERNIFSPYGSYAMSGAVFKGPLPERPYTLIGVLKGEEKKAVFREYTGAIVTLSVGKKLIDGSVITRIDTTSVEVKKGKEKRKLKIFEVIVPKLSTVKKP